MESAAKGRKVDEGTGDGLKSPVFQGFDKTLLPFFNDHPFLVQHQHIERDPFAAHGKGPGRKRLGFRRDQDVPGFEYPGQFLDIQVFGVHQQLARGERDKRGINVHGRPAAAFDFVDRIGVAQMSPEPGNAQIVGYIALGYENIFSATGEMMSPRISALPFMHPTGLVALRAGSGGLTSAIGSPCLVTRMGFPVSRTFRSSSRQVALNFEMLTSSIGKSYYGQ